MYTVSKHGAWQLSARVYGEGSIAHQQCDTCIPNYHSH